MFSKEELDNMTADQVHAAFKMYCAGASADDTRAAALGKAQPPKERQNTNEENRNQAMDIIRNRASARKAATEAAKTALSRYFRQ